LIIHQEICVGCGSCQPYCPPGAISFSELISVVDQDKCYECGTCLRVEICPVDAIAESADVYEYPRALRKYFSDATTTHAVTGIEGRGTEESKTNDVTGRVGPDDVGVAIEVGRPTLGMDLFDIQTVTIHSMINDPKTGDLKPELLGERVLSAIIEIQVKRDRLPLVLRTVKAVATEVKSVFCLDVYTQLEPGLQVPQEVLDIITAEGFAWQPNAKINLGLGRALKAGT
jgi:NAD-dependent dihydropyrimidine dehydrogenase PreA subunit